MSKNVLSSNNTPEENNEYLRSVLVPKGTQRISWEKSIGCTIEYEYDYYGGGTHKGSLTISRYENKYIYFEGFEKSIYTGDLQRCKLGGILGIITSDFKYEVGDIVNGLLIIDREYRDKEHKPNKKGRIYTQKYKYYKYHCNICNHEDWMLEGDLNRGNGCNACGDGISYPEKFMYSTLEQLNIKFEMQFSNFDWINNIRYDFYIPSVDLILEVHGGQHGKFIAKDELIFVKRTKGFTMSDRDDIKIDAEKCWLAYDNGIENYIQLDCYYSNMEYIKNNILNSDLSKLFDLSNIDWNKCEEFALSNLVKEVCDYWNEHREINSEDISTKDLAKIFKIAKNTIIDYLKRGTELGWCNYNPKEENKRSGKVSGGQNNQPIYCPQLGRIFESAMDAERKLKINHSHISDVLNGKRKTSGGYHWKRVDKDSNYYKNYLKQKKVA